MNDNSFLLVLLVVGAILGALLLLSTSSSTPASTAGAASAGFATTTPRGATSWESVWANAGEDRIAGERETIRLEGSGGDSGGGSVIYRWTADSSLGFFLDPTLPDAKYTAPSACDCCEAVTLTLTVISRSGSTASDSVTVRVRDPIGCPSERPCGELAAAIPSPCPPVAVGSRCPKPDVPCGNPCVSEAPPAPVCLQTPVPCRCAGGCEAAWDAAWPQVVPALAAHDRPTPRIVRQFPAHVPEGSVTSLRADVTNPGCSSVCFTWAASQGWLDRTDTLNPVYHAPLTERGEGERVTITFTIVDATGRPSSDQIRLHVDNVPSF